MAVGGVKHDERANTSIHKHPVSIDNSVYSVTVQQDARQESVTETWREQSAHKTNSVAGTLSIHVTDWWQLRMQGRLLAHAQVSHVDSRTSYHLYFIQLRCPQGAMYFYASNEHADTGRRIFPWATRSVSSEQKSNVLETRFVSIIRE